MFGFRTPAKKATATDTRKTPEQTEKAGPSQPTQTASSSVRRSIGELESGKVEARPQVNPSKGPPPKPETSQGSKPSHQRASVEFVITPPPPRPKYASKMTEAKACVTKAKTLIGESRNLRADIKTGVLQAIDRLYQLAKEGMGASAPIEQAAKVQDKERGVESASATPTDPAPQAELMKELMQNIKEHRAAILDCKKHTTALTAEIKKFPVPSESEQGRTYAEVTKLTKTITDLRNDLSSQAGSRPARTEAAPQQRKAYAAPLHSIIISSDGDSSQELITKLRDAVDAKNTGIRVDRLRKAKDQKIVVGCLTKEEIGRVSEAARAKNLQVKEAQNKDPLIVVRDVLALHTDEEVVSALKVQNSHLMADVEEQHLNLAVKYRKKARNPHTNHIVLQVSPIVWQRLTAAGRVHIDLQRLRVEDQSPLIQCSLCLGYGHTRRLCGETVEKCSYCGGPHKWVDCADRLVGEAPTCCNCIHAKFTATDHSAFNQECPVRRKWDALARATTAYC